jgi:hypothetical protein
VLNSSPGLQKVVSTGAALFLLALIASSCDPVSGNDERFGQSVICLIDAGVDTQRVYVFRTTTLGDVGGGYHSDLPTFEEPEAWHGKYFVNDADVECAVAGSPSTKAPLATDSLSGGVATRSYAWVGGAPIRGGMRCSCVVSSSLGSVSGETVVPGGVTIVSPDPESIFPKGVDIELRWTRSVGAAGYAVVVNGQRQALRGAEDTLFTFSANPLSEFPGETTLEVVACDEHYYDALSRNGESAGIHGGYGVMGSMSRTSMVIGFR